MNQLFLSIDSTGYPSRWLSWQDAVTHEVLGKVSYGFGDYEFTFTGGKNRDTGLNSQVTLKSILVMHGRNRVAAHHVSIPLSNHALFRRDRFMCAYCGDVHARGLTRDHIVPLSRGGSDSWLNVCACCRLSRSNSLPVYDVSELPPLELANCLLRQTRSRYQFELRVRVRNKAHQSSLERRSV